ncbi:MAG: ATP synthase F0 subunit A, partial [Flavobacterium sp.]|nr:ATP synthase F0 subunit A [Flavobacterium sp.]
MVFSKKPLRFIIATLVAFLPLVSSANPTVDTTQVSAETTHVVEATHGESAEPKDVKTEIKEFIDHHLKDSYDFNIFGYKDEAG